jgi:hypothetical protein
MLARRWMCWWKAIDNGISVGRSYRDAPEIDGMVLSKGRRTSGILSLCGSPAHWSYDLTGVLVEEKNLIKL